MARRGTRTLAPPQGGILSPLLSNIALSVLDEHFAEARAKLTPRARETRRRKGLANYRLIRCADDFVVLVAGTRVHAESLRDESAAVLGTMGLSLSDEKTRIAHIDEGFDFLGYRIQRQQRPHLDHQPQDLDPSRITRKLPKTVTSNWILDYAGPAVRPAVLAAAMVVSCLAMGCGNAENQALSLSLSSGERISGTADATCAVPGKTRGAVEFALFATESPYLLNVHSRLYRGPGTYALSPGAVMVTYDESSGRPV